MAKINIKFTPQQSDALAWRLGQGFCIEQVFEDSDDQTQSYCAPMAAARSDVLYEELLATSAITINTFDTQHTTKNCAEAILDREILYEAIAGSTWVAAFDPANDTNNTPQKFAAAKRVLQQVANKVQAAYALPADYIEVPTA